MATRKNSRAAQGSGTIRQRSDGRWEARYTVGRDPGTGKQVQRSIYGTTQKEVRQKLQQASIEIDNDIYIEPSKTSLGKWLDIWLKEYTLNVKPQTRVSYETQIRVHIKPALGAVKLLKLNAHMVQVFINSLTQESDKKQAIKPKSVKNVNSVLYGALNQAVRLGYIRSNPCIYINLPRVIPAEMHPLSQLEMTKFVDAIEGTKYSTLFIFTMFTGLRLGEVTGLTWDRINFKDGTILIDRQLMREKIKGGKHLLVSVKNDRPRKLNPAPFIMKLINRHKANQAQQRLQSGSLWNDNEIPGLVFTNDFRKYYIHNTVTHNIARIAASIGINHFCFHDLRHTYAVNALRAGDDVKTVQSNLGHATAAFTLDRYGHYTDDMRKDSANRMEAFAKGIVNL